MISVPDDIQLVAPPPAGVQGGAAQVFGQAGIRQYYYWIVARYPIGVAISGPFFVRHAPNVLTAANYVLVVWNASPGALTYDVLRTETNQLPSAPGNYALVIGATDTEFTDQGQPLTFYDITGLPWGSPVSRGITLNNRDYTQPTIQIDTQLGVTQIIFEDGTVQDTAGAPEAPSDGLAYGRKDNTWVPVVQLAGDTMTGPLILSEAPVAPFQAVTKEYVDAKLGVDEAPFTDDAYGRFHYGWIPCVKLLGDTMTGPLVLAGDPVLQLEAAPKQYVDRALTFAPNRIANLILWLVPNDRAGAPVITVSVGDLPEGYPVPFDTLPLLDRTGVASQNATGIATLVPAWGAQAASTWITPASTANRYFTSRIGVNRFPAGWTFVMLWMPYDTSLNPNAWSTQMGYRVAPDFALIGPCIILGNPGAGIGFTAFASDGSPKTTDTFEIGWNPAINNPWYMVGCDGQSGTSFKLRVNGQNSTPVALGTLNTAGCDQMIWGNGGMGLLLEACIFDRRLTNQEYLQIEGYWTAKYANIRLGTVTGILPPFPRSAFNTPEAPAARRRHRGGPAAGGLSAIWGTAAQWARSNLWVPWTSVRKMS